VATAASASFPSVGHLDGTRFFNRELSWLDFDRRVLEFASDRGVPLMERVKLCGIVASNLDEFFAVRVARLRSQVKAHTLRRFPDGRTPAETLRAVRAAILALQADQDALWLDELRPALEDAGLRFVPVEACTASERRSLSRRFQHEVQPLLTSRC
jgi:polyphosphate kinase